MGRHQDVSYHLIAEAYIDAVVRGLPPVATVAKALGLGAEVLAGRVEDMRRTGWLPSGRPEPGRKWKWQARATLAAKLAAEAHEELVGYQSITTQTLRCGAGHDWARPRVPGRPPMVCPDHAANPI